MVYKRWHCYRKLLLVLSFLLILILVLRYESSFILLSFLNWFYNDELEEFRLSNDIIDSHNSLNVQYLKLNEITSLFNGGKINLTDGLLPLPLCNLLPNNLNGPLKLDLNLLTYEELNKKYENVLGQNSGGHWIPDKCTARYKVAIVVPYRNRDEQLRLFISHMHGYLQKQLIDYSIYIVEEKEGLTFNRGLLMNIGFAEAIKDYDWDCVVFHDVDLLPEDDRNLYYCPILPRHMSVSINVFNYKLPYAEIFGGVSAINSDHFKYLNGYSNLYFGWGGEDDDMYSRHTLLEKVTERIETDGLNSLNYTVLAKQHKRLYTWLLVSFNDRI